jgi:hypothetical protein
MGEVWGAVFVLQYHPPTTSRLSNVNNISTGTRSPFGFTDTILL